jgi:hypothetical protein
VRWRGWGGRRGKGAAAGVVVVVVIIYIIIIIIIIVRGLVAMSVVLAMMLLDGLPRCGVELSRLGSRAPITMDDTLIWRRPIAR